MSLADRVGLGQKTNCGQLLFSSSVVPFSASSFFFTATVPIMISPVSMLRWCCKNLSFVDVRPSSSDSRTMLRSSRCMALASD